MTTDVKTIIYIVIALALWDMFIHDRLTARVA